MCCAGAQRESLNDDGNDDGLQEVEPSVAAAQRRHHQTLVAGRPTDRRFRTKKGARSAAAGCALFGLGCLVRETSCLATRRGDAASASLAVRLFGLGWPSRWPLRLLLLALLQLLSLLVVSALQLLHLLLLALLELLLPLLICVLLN